jgi:glyoxylase-like metal-dependent hydrolase (beta-lactamase superfamily II)
MSEKYELEMVTPHTIANTSGIGKGNVGAIALNNFILVIDSSMYVSTAQEFRKKLEAHFKLPVGYLIITHYHADHIFGMKTYKDIPMISGMEVFNNLQSDDIKKRYESYVFELEKEDPLGKNVEFLLPNILFNNQIIINDEDLRVEIKHVGGHTSGSSYVYFPEEKVLFAGDLIFEDMFPYAGDITCDPEKWIKAIEEMISLNPDYIVPGHGPLMKGKEKLHRHLEFFIEFRQIIKDAVKNDLKIEEIGVPPTFEEVDPELKFLTVNHWLKFYRK